MMNSRNSKRKNMREIPKTTQGSAGVSSDGGDGGYNAGIAVFSYIIGGIIVWSLIGWGLDYLWGTRWIVLAGALLGESVCRTPRQDCRQVHFFNSRRVELS
jgi:F0F1-type ATP synthase assembly protein I